MTAALLGLRPLGAGEQAGLMADPDPVRVVSLRHYQARAQETALYIGRGKLPTLACGSALEHAHLGNPFKVGHGYLRGEAVRAFERHLRSECTRKEGLYHPVLTLAGRVCAGERLAFLCYCAPQPCHGDVLKRAVLGYAQRLQAGGRV